MKTMIGLGIAAVLLLMPAVGQAEDFDVREHLDQMKQELDLTPKQTEEIKPILNEYKDQLDQAREEKREKLDEVLNDERMDKLDELDKSWFDKMKSKLERTDEPDADKATTTEYEKDKEKTY